MSRHLAECVAKICRTSSFISAHPQWSSTLMVKGRLPERSNHSVTSRGRLWSYSPTRGHRMWSEVQSSGVTQASCRHFWQTAPRYNGLSSNVSKHALGGEYWRKIWEAISGGNWWIRGSWFSFMTVRSARRLMCIFSILVSNSVISISSWVIPCSSWVISCSSSMSSVQAAYSFPSKATHRSGRRTFMLDRLCRTVTSTVSWILITL